MLALGLLSPDPVWIATLHNALRLLNQPVPSVSGQVADDPMQVVGYLVDVRDPTFLTTVQHLLFVKPYLALDDRGLDEDDLFWFLAVCVPIRASTWPLIDEPTDLASGLLG